MRKPVEVGNRNRTLKFHRLVRRLLMRAKYEGQRACSSHEAEIWAKKAGDSWKEIK